jgi:hypothetical protein
MNADRTGDTHTIRDGNTHFMKASMTLAPILSRYSA